MSLPIDPALQRRALDEACRQRFYFFVQRFFFLVGSGELVPNWHHDALTYGFERIFRREVRRLLVTIAPRSLKSIIASVLFPAWALGRDPKLQFICASYSMELATKLARDCRTVMRSPEYQRIFPRTVLDRAKQNEQELMTAAGGSRRAVSVGGTLTGLGGDHIICDDLMNALDAGSKAARDQAGDWTDTVMRSRLNDPTRGSISIIGQRLHQDDPIGRILERESDLWEHIDIPAIAETRQVFDLGRGRTHVREPDDLLEPVRMPRTFLDEQRRVIGTMNFSAQYQQRPVPEQGNLVRREWFQEYHFNPMQVAGTAVFQSWDLATRTGEANDYSVCITFGLEGGDHQKGDIYLMDVFREKLLYPDLRKAVLRLAKEWRARTVIIEDKGSGMGLIDDLKREGIVRPVAYVPKGDKVERLTLQSAKIEQERIFLPMHLQFAEDFLAEVLGFPNVRYDDQVDALTQFLDYLDTKSKHVFRVGTIGEGGRVTFR